MGGLISSTGEAWKETAQPVLLISRAIKGCLLLETRVPAPPPTSNYPCWSRRGKSHLAFELPKNTIFFNIYSVSFLPTAFDLAPAGSARRVSGPV